MERRKLPAKSAKTGWIRVTGANANNLKNLDLRIPVGRLTVIAGPILSALGQTQDIHPYRRANILDAVVNSFSFIIPWHVWPILMILQIRPLQDANALIPVPASTDFLTATFYPVAIWCVMLLAILTGYGRKFEGPSGEVVTRHE